MKPLENIWSCALYGKVARLCELAPTIVDVQPGPRITVPGPRLIGFLFGETYGAFALRASDSSRFSLLLHPDAHADIPTFDTVAQSFLSSTYESIIRAGDAPEIGPDFYGILAPAAAHGWPVYFLAVGMGLRLPAEAYRGRARPVNR